MTKKIAVFLNDFALKPVFKGVFWGLLLICANAWANDAKAKHLLVFGDSLSAAYGMDWELGWAQLLDQHWQNAEGEVVHRVSNASISGETSVGGLDRLPLTLEELNPDVVLLELGANDGLRGYPISRIRENLLKMVDLVEASGADVIIAGISLPPSYGPRYIDQFRAMFRDVAESRELPFIDFFREDFIGKPGYIQADGLHPTEITQPIIRDALLSFFAEEGLFQ
ncbi:MAG: arylesterase [Pseudomonadota bacterium]